MRRHLIAVVLAAGSMLVPASTALGSGSVGLANDDFSYSGDAGTATWLHVGETADDYTFYDELGAVAPGAGCVQDGTPDRVRCAKSGASELMVALGDLNDQITLTTTALRAEVHAGPGEDVLRGATHSGAMWGEEGADLILAEEPGTSPLTPDRLNGGNDGAIDAVSYETRVNGIRVTQFDGSTPNDGEPGEHDNLGGFEVIRMGGGDDIWVGFAVPETVFGNGGNDYLQGDTANDPAVGAHPDTMNGGAGTDRAIYAGRLDPVTVRLNGSVLSCGNGAVGENDCLADIEHVRGTEADDTLVGGAGDDILEGMGGDDYLQPKGGQDDVRGGAGTNDRVAYVDRTASQAVSVSLDGVANDGAPGENDLVRSDVESARGGAGDDLLVGNAGANLLAGEGGDDTLEPRGGTDEVRGGAGTADRVSYADRPSSVPVAVRLNGKADDGAAGENDLVRSDVEGATGGAAGDTLVGNAAANLLSGGGGSDYLEPHGGGDDVVGGPGAGDRATYANDGVAITASLDDVANDGAAGHDDNIHSDVEELRGGPMGDVLFGNAGANILQGLGGPDELRPGAGPDRAVGGEGDDTTYAADGEADTIDCGGGFDTTFSDPVDALGASCEPPSGAA